MSEKNENIFPIYTLQRSVEMSKQNIADKTHYLHANGIAQLCPFMSKGTEGIFCGTHCAKFDIVPQKDKDGKPVGTVLGIQSCGTLRTIPLSNLKIDIENKDSDEEAKTISINR